DTITVGSLTLASSQPRPGVRAKPPMLFIPGYFASAWVYESYLPFFADRGYAGFALNLRGREGSALPSGTMLGRVSINDFIDDARQVARWLTERLSRPIVVGHSMGGLLRRQLRYLPALLRSRRVVPRWSDMRELVLNRVPEAEQQAAFARFVSDSGRAGREMSFGAIRVDAERVRANGCPVLVVTSDDDRFIPPRIAQRIA